MPYKDPEARKRYNQQYREQNRERLGVYLSEWKASNPDAHRDWAAQNLDHLADYAKTRRAHLREIDPEWVAHEAEMRRDWKERNREKSRKAIARWKRDHPEYGQQKRGRRRARLLNAEINDLTIAEWREILETWQYKCAYCDTEPEVLTLDHVVPLARGGNHTRTNVVPACFDCNSRKRDELWTPQGW